MPAWSAASQPEQRRADDVDDVVDGRQDALAAVAALVAVAQLDRLVGAGGGARRDGRPADGAVVEDDVDLDGRVAARVEDLAGVDESIECALDSRLGLPGPSARAVHAGRRCPAAPGPRGTRAMRRRRSRRGSSGRPGPAARRPRPSRRRRRRRSRRPRPARPGTGHGPRAVAEGRDLEHARAGRSRRPSARGSSASSNGSSVCLPTSTMCHDGRDLLGRERLVLGAPGDLLGHDDVDRQDDPDALLLGRREDALGVLDPVVLGRLLPTVLPWARRKVLAIPPPMTSRSTLATRCVEDLDLARDLGAADDRGERPLGRLQQEPREHRDLALHEQARRRPAGASATPTVEAWARWAVPKASLT